MRQAVTVIAQDNPERARNSDNELIDRALSLGTFPERGRVVPEIGEPAVREIIHRPFRIIYEFFPEQAVVYVLRFWHGARGEPEIKAGE